MFNRLQSTFPFIGGVLVLFIGAHFHDSIVLLLGLIMTAVGFVYMVRGNRNQQADYANRQQTIDARARRLD